jgi:hypothetical protein
MSSENKYNPHQLEESLTYHRILQTSLSKDYIFVKSSLDNSLPWNNNPTIQYSTQFIIQHTF